MRGRGYTWVDIRMYNGGVVDLRCGEAGGLEEEGEERDGAHLRDCDSSISILFLVRQ